MVALDGWLVAWWLLWKMKVSNTLQTERNLIKELDFQYGDDGLERCAS